MRDIAYEVRGFLTVRRDSLRVPLRGSLTVHAGPGAGHFTGDLVMRPAAIARKVLGVSLFGATVRIDAEAPVAGQIDEQGRMSATVTVDAVLTAVRLAGWTLIDGGSCRTATHAVVPLCSRPGFDMARGGRLAGRYQRPPFTGCGRLTPVINLLVAGSGNTAVIDLVPGT
jgi:hypothetical protein